MEPAPKAELPPKPVPEAKPVPAPAKEEKPAGATPKAPESGARATLEKIATGTPVMEATKPPENLPNRETVTALLNEANTLLLDMKDLRLWMNAIATQAADTPLGNEVRLEALRSMLTVNGSGLPPETAGQLSDLQDRIRALKLPEKNPAESAVVATLTRYNESHPDTKVPDDVMEAVKSGKTDGAEAVAKMMQSDKDLAEMTWKELTGVDGFTELTPSPEAMLDLAGIAKSPENIAKAQEIFGIVREMKEPGAWKESLVMNFMYFALFMQFFNSIALGEGGGGH